MKLLRWQLKIIQKSKHQILNLDFLSPNFTCDTLKFLRTKNPEIEYIFIMGSDLLEEFDKWNNYEGYFR